MRLRRLTRILLPLVVGLAGSWLAILAAGRYVYPVGPFRVELYARPGPGVTEIALPPFGRIRADTHLSPLKLTARLDEVATTELTSVVRRKGIDGLALEVEEEGLVALARHARRELVIGVLGAVAAGLIIFRGRWRPALAAGLTGFVALAASAGFSWATYRPEAFLQPTFTGSLALAPRLVGPLREATGRIEDFRAELERLVEGATTAYAEIAGSRPAADADTVVLHISDVHLSPLGMDFAQRLAASFQADLVVDTGDLASFGTVLERGITERIGEFEIPYVFVRGNHDSPETVRQVEAQPNTIVLSGGSREVAGLVIHGAPHPLFTPEEERGLPDEVISAAVRSVGDAIAESVAAQDPPPDVLAVHDDRTAEASAGLVPIVISGHFHSTGSRHIDDTLFLRVGSTGGGGVVTFAEDGGSPLAAQLLYFEGSPPRLLAWDTVELDPLTGNLTVDRHLPEGPEEEIEAPAEPEVSPQAEAANEKPAPEPVAPSSGGRVTRRAGAPATRSLRRRGSSVA